MVEVLFYLTALAAIASAVGVVVARSPVASVVSLLGTFFCLSVVYLLAGYQFLAAIQILVYGGAVMVLFLFVVMLLNLGDVTVARSESEPLFHGTSRAIAGLGVAACLGAAGLVTVAASAPYLRAAQPFVVPDEGLDPIGALAEAMFTRYSLPFEAASVLLLAAAVGVLVIAKRQRRPVAPAPERATPAPDAPRKAPEPEPEEVLS